MAFTYTPKDIRCTSFSPVGYEQTFVLDFVVRSTTASNAVEVCVWLRDQLPLDLSSYGSSDVPLNEFHVSPQDPNNPVVFFGEATYRKRQSSDGSRDSGGSGSIGAVEGTRISFRENTYEVPVEEALNVNGEKVPVLNSAGDPFVDPLTEVEKRLVIIVEKTYAWSAASPTQIGRFSNSVNLNPIVIADEPIPQRGGWIQSIKPVVRVYPGDTYDWRITFEIEVKGHGENYDRRVLDRGYVYLVEDDTGSILKTYGPYGSTWVSPGEEEDPEDYLSQYDPDAPIRYRRERATIQNPDTGEIQPSPEPVLLNGNGEKLAAGRSPVFLTFRSKREIDWFGLGLPDSIREIV